MSRTTSTSDSDVVGPQITNLFPDRPAPKEFDDYGDTKPTEAPPLKKLVTPEINKELDKPQPTVKTIWPW